MVKDRKQKSGDFWEVLQRKEPESPGSRSCSPPCPSWFLLLCMKTWWPMYCQPSFLVRGPWEWKPHAGSNTEEPGGPAYTDATKSFCALASAPVQCSFAAPPRERWSHFLHPLNLAWGVPGWVGWVGCLFSGSSWCGVSEPEWQEEGLPAGEMVVTEIGN